MSGIQPVAEGITSPAIDDLLKKTDSKYRLVLYSAKRARQINAYYAQLGEGLLEYVGPLVDTHVQEKPLSIALREINEDLLTAEDLEPGEESAQAGRQPTPSAGAAALTSESLAEESLGGSPAAVAMAGDALGGDALGGDALGGDALGGDALGEEAGDGSAEAGADVSDADVSDADTSGDVPPEPA